MTDKMREALLAAKKIIANPHGYTEISVLVAEALIGQAAQSEKSAELEVERVPEAILEIGRRMIADAKDNDHHTAHPMFRVEKRRIVTGIDTDCTDNIAWIDEDGEILDPEEAATLEAAYDDTGEVPDSYTRTGFVEEWEHVDTYLTQQAAEARINGGKDGRVNVGSAYRNSEMRAVREFLMSLAAAQQPKEAEATGKPGLQVDVERVPEGWKLVPIEPTPDMLSATSWPGCAGTDYKHMLAAAPAPEGWIPVSERLPEPETDVLIFARHHQRPHIAQVMVAGLFGPNKDQRELEWMDNVSESMIPRRWWVTYWMPLPAAPKKGVE